MTAFYKDFVFCSGDDRTLRFTITDEAGAPVNLGGVQSVRWGCARLLPNGSYVLPASISKALQTGVSVADAAGGIIEVALESNDTAALAEGFANVKTQAERTTIAKALFGREGAKLLPLLEQGAAKLREYQQAASDAGAVLSGDLEKAYADLGDRLDAAAKKLEVQKGRILPEAAEATVRYAEAVAGAAKTLADFLDDVRQDLGPSVFDDIVDAAVTVNLPGGPLMLLWGTIKGIINDAGNLPQHGATGSWGGGATGSWGGATGEWEPQSPLPRPTARPAIPLPRGSGRGGWPDSGKTSKGRKSGSGRRGPQYVDIVTGAPHTPTEDELYLLAHPAKPRPVGGLEEFQDAADQIEKRNNELMASLQRAWLQASDQRVALINFERDQQLKALDDVELSEEQLAVARLAINTTADKKVADESLSFTKSTDEATESAVNLKDTIQGFGQVATSAFEDAIIKGEKFSDVLNGLAEDIQRLVLRNTLNKLFDIAIDAGGKFASSLFSSTPSGPSTPGTPITAQPRTWDAAGWNAFLAEGNAYGNAFSGGNVIPFARGGVVHRPTLFPMARGMAPGHFVPGVMGEAGPEAVVPLRRMPSGNLGVEAGGGGVVVNIINNTPAQVRTEEKRDGQGRMNLNVVIDAVETAMAQRAARPGTSLNKALATAANPIRAR